MQIPQPSSTIGLPLSTGNSASDSVRSIFSCFALSKSGALEKILCRCDSDKLKIPEMWSLKLPIASWVFAFGHETNVKEIP